MSEGKRGGRRTEKRLGQWVDGEADRENEEWR